MHDHEASSRPGGGAEVASLVAELEATRWTGRPGYHIRSMVGMALVKSLYTIPTWSRTAALVAEHAALRAALGGEAPSVYACYRFAAKLRRHRAALDARIAAVLASLHDEVPELGRDVAIDGSDLPAYANGQRFVYNHGPERKRFSDPDASWDTVPRSRPARAGYYGYKVHAAVCATTGLPVAWQFETAKDAEAPAVPTLLDSLLGRGFDVDTCAMDRGYDVGPVYEACESRGIRPVVPLKETPFVKAGKHLPPTCEHGTWTFAGSDAKRGASSNAGPQVSARPARRGSRPTGCTPSSLGRRPGGRSSTGDAPAWSVSSGAWSTNGPCCPFGFGGSSTST